jgi:hypothetical protein
MITFQELSKGRQYKLCAWPDLEQWQSYGWRLVYLTNEDQFVSEHRQHDGRLIYQSGTEIQRRLVCVLEQDDASAIADLNKQIREIKAANNTARMERRDSDLAAEKSKAEIEKLRGDLKVEREGRTRDDRVIRELNASRTRLEQHLAAVRSVIGSQEYDRITAAVETDAT